MYEERIKELTTELQDLKSKHFNYVTKTDKANKCPLCPDLQKKLTDLQREFNHQLQNRLKFRRDHPSPKPFNRRVHGKPTAGTNVNSGIFDYID